MWDDSEMIAKISFELEIIRLSTDLNMNPDCSVTEINLVQINF